MYQKKFWVSGTVRASPDLLKDETRPVEASVVSEAMPFVSVTTSPRETACGCDMWVRGACSVDCDLVTKKAENPMAGTSGA